MAGEEPWTKPISLNDEQAKDEAYHATRGGEEAVHPGEAVPDTVNGTAIAGNQHHAGNRYRSRKPAGTRSRGGNANRGEHEERNRGGPARP